MKKLLFLLSICFSLAAGAQTPKMFCLQPACKQTITTTDSATIFAQLTASDGYGSINWSLRSGPSLILPPAKVVYITGIQAASGFIVRNLAAGTYVFQATGTSQGGSSGTVTDTLVVNPARLPQVRAVYQITVYSDSTKKTIIY